MKRILVLLGCLGLMLALTACGGEEDLSPVRVAIEVEGYGEIVVQLEPEVAPLTVENFLNLVNENFYDGLTFHRIINGFMIQGGCPEGTGRGGSEDRVVGEFSSNGIENTLSHSRGVISMARSSDPDSARSQFFIMHQDVPGLDGDYAAFGEVVSGMEIVDALAVGTPVEDRNGTVAPVNQPRIVTIRVIDED